MTKDRDNDCFLWGDEVYPDQAASMEHQLKHRKTEGLLLISGKEMRQVQPYTCAASLLKELNTDKEYLEHDDLAYCAAEFHPEGGSFMLESTPEKPWGVSSRDLLDVEANMKSRYDRFLSWSFYILMLKPECAGVP